MIVTDGAWRVPHILTAEAMVAAADCPVYMFEFQPDPGSFLTALIFDQDLPAITATVNLVLASQLSTAWMSFARHHDPNHRGIPHWPAYSLTDRATMMFDYDCRIERDPRAAERRAWNGLLPPDRVF